MSTAIIKKITIKNFRSIEKIDFETNNLSIFVGSNDAGKSNILRALNLFFNNQTDYDTYFDFANDFSKTAKIGINKAKEIVITLEIIPPYNYKFDGEYIIWTKKWRREGLVHNENAITDQDKNLIPNRSKVPAWLRNIKYRYVPAIKGNDFFALLLSDLHDTLAYVNEKKFHDALQKFMNEVQKQTIDISTTLLDSLNIKSSISVPADLKQLFSTLEFETEITKDLTVSLNQRGDGIKTRHIPVILNFMAENEGFAKSKGAVASQTIWGYEEPENNLEMSKAFEVAKSFIDYQQNVQIFLTTHSPAFYLLEKDSDDCNVFFVQQSENSTKLTAVDEPDSMHDNMGMMPIIAPYIKNKIDELKKLNDVNTLLITQLQQANKPVLYVEGKTDKLIIESAWGKIFPNKKIPYTLIDSFGSGNIKALFNSKILYDSKLIISLLDFDDAYGIYENIWSNDNPIIIESSHEKGLIKKHKDHERYVCLLPIPASRLALASTELKSQSKVCIEFLFEDEIIEDYITEKISVGGGKYPQFIDTKKDIFSKEINKLEADKFQNFNLLFNQLDYIFKRYSESIK
ncbi:MAG TPA: AAA family ATPase [Sulfuricurvum sp.]|nr:AAA family ATPase [Sulfuricurvum sp.]